MIELVVWICKKYHKDKNIPGYQAFETDTAKTILKNKFL